MQLVRALEGKLVMFFAFYKNMFPLLSLKCLGARHEQLTQAMGEAAQLKQRGNS